ncbi:hypothetical protein EVAR_97358_1 [Eumeta japonica]|uniref:Uncharacterized protein n=1 Tax=Eumeta variegata TaxID=151549 RepID=A0A4C1YZC7_EUMVA|nr:hypothetical protein EVAR_97358_1 [Eumeta japonica]
MDYFGSSVSGVVRGRCGTTGPAAPPRVPTPPPISVQILIACAPAVRFGRGLFNFAQRVMSQLRACKLVRGTNEALGALQV